MPFYPTPLIPVTQPTDPNAVTNQMTSIVNQAIPGYSNLSRGASGVVGNLMGGLPSAAPTQRANAYFGTNSGMPGSDFVRNRGFDLYGQQAEQYKQRGFDDFLKLLSGTVGTVTPTAGQQQQQGQFDKELQLRQQQANTPIYAANNQQLNREQLLADQQAKEGSFWIGPLGRKGPTLSSSGNVQGF